MSLDELAPPSVCSATLHLMALSFAVSLLLGVHLHHFSFESGSSCHKNQNGHTSEFLVFFFFF